MLLTKIYANDCHVCQQLGDKAKTVAEEAGFVYGDVELSVLASGPSPIRDYVSNYHLDKDGMVDLPIYVITTEQGVIQGSSVVKNLDEVTNLVAAWTKWSNTQNKGQ